MIFLCPSLLSACRASILLNDEMQKSFCKVRAFSVSAVADDPFEKASTEKRRHNALYQKIHVIFLFLRAEDLGNGILPSKTAAANAA